MGFWWGSVYHKLMQDLSFPVILERSKKRSKSIAILVTHERGVVVQAPHRTSDRYIRELILERKNWILQKLQSFQARAKLEPEHTWENGETLLYLGEPYRLELGPVPAKKGQCELFDDTLFVRLTARSALSQTAQCKKLVETWYRQQAKMVLTERSQYFAERMQVEPRAIIVKQQKTRWGSCDRQNIIRYNWQIIKAPPALLDYLVVHELAHIRLKNHSKAFWSLVASEIPDYLLRRKALKAFHPH